MSVYLGASPVVAADPEMSVPTGEPIFRWLCAPRGLATRRQLAALRLRPGGRPPVAFIVWRRDQRWAALWPVHLAVPKRAMTPGRRAALDAAMRARRTCPTCGRDAGYVIPTSLGTCLDCHDGEHGQGGEQL